MGPIGPITLQPSWPPQDIILKVYVPVPVATERLGVFRKWVVLPECTGEQLTSVGPTLRRRAPGCQLEM